MKKIGQFIEEMNELLGVKVAFIPAPPQAGQQDPTQGGGQQQGGQDPMAQLMQQLPPEMAQQIQQLPPEQQQQALQQVLSQMQGGGEQPQQGGGQPQGMPQDPSGGDPNTGLTTQDGSANAAGHVKAENQLDNTQVTLTVRELMDITSGGKATQSLLKVKQMASQHNNKMNADQQKMQQQAAQAQMDQQAAAQGMGGGGGIYSQAPDMSGKAPAQ